MNEEANWNISQAPFHNLLTQLFTEHTYSLVANNLTLSIMEQDFERYNERNLSDTLFEDNSEEFDYILDWYENHPMKSATPMPEWIY